MNELLQNNNGFSKEGENLLEGFVYEDAIIDYGVKSVNDNLKPIIEALSKLNIKFKSSLELGSGNGSFSWQLKELYPDNIVCTCDINKDSKLLPYYNKLNHFIVRTDELFKISNNDKDYFEFDLILSFEHFEHISPSKLDILGQNINNHSKKGTIFFGSAPSYDRGYNNAGLVHPNCKSQKEWDMWFEGLGWSKLSFTILNNRNEFNIPFEAYMNSSELLYKKI